VALDYNAPLLTLAAQHVISDTSDPYFTQLQAGAYEKVRPSGTPCDEAFPCEKRSRLSKNGKIALAVVLSVVGCVIFVLLGCYVWLAGRGASKTAAS
jgi:endoglucanase